LPIADAHAMGIGQIYMLLALLSFSLLGVLHKLADVKRCRPSAVNALLYAWSLCFALGLMTLGKGTGPDAPSSVVAIALPFGISASVAILAFQAGIKHGYIATSWLAINLSAGIPTVASVLIYDEPVLPSKAIALCLIPVSMFLLWKDKKEDERRREALAGGSVPVARGGRP
jgi:drug/metabolite transporter (DMT)-like permease